MVQSPTTMEQMELYGLKKDKSCHADFGERMQGTALVRAPMTPEKAETIFIPQEVGHAM